MGRNVNIDDYEYKGHVGEITEEDCIVYVENIFDSSMPEEFMKELPQDELDSIVNGAE